MNKAQQMLAKAGFPDTKAGRAAFHKQYPTPESFFQVHGGQDTEMYGAGSTIHIDPSKRGTFTAAATKHGKSVQAFASQVLANKENYSPAMVKKANFARNAASWKHEDGGPVMYAEGGKLPEGILRSRLEAHMSPNEAQNYINKYDAGSMVNDCPCPPSCDCSEDIPREGSTPTSALYERFPKKRPKWSPPGYVWWGDRDKPRRPHYANPHKGVKDAIINMHTITGSCESGTCFEFEDGGPIGISSVSTQRTLQDNNNYVNNYESSIADTEGFRQYYKQDTPGSYVHYAGSPEGQQLNVNGAYVNDPFMQNFLYQRAGNKATMHKNGGVVDVYQLMGMPTPPMYNYGSHITHYTPSYNFGHVQSANNTYRHGYGYGGSVNMYKKGGFTGFLEDAGKFTLNNMAAPIEQISGNNFVNFDYNNKGFADAAAVTEGLIGAGTDIAGTYFGGPVYSMAKSQVQGITSNLGHSTEYQKGASDTANKTGQIIGSTGNLISGIASGNPQQIVSGASNVLGTTGGQLGSKELSVIGQLGGIGSQFVGMGGGMGNKAGAATSITPSGSTNFGTGIPGGDLSNFGIGFAAMGGAVNAPNMMKYAQGGGVDMTDINVEHNELLVNQNGDILTEYGSNALPPHPADGSMDDRGTVPAPVGAFVITKALAEEYKAATKNNDKLYTSAMRNNIAFDKQRKEAKEQAQQQMMQDMMSAKFGGMVRGYGYGGGVKMFAAGGPPGPLESSENTGYVYNFGEEDPNAAVNMYDFDASTPFNFMDLSKYGTQPSRYYSPSTPNMYPSPNAYGNPAAAPVYNAGNLTSYTPTNFKMPSVGAPNKNAFINSQVYGSNPNTSYGPWNAQNAPTSPIAPTTQDLQNSQGPLGNRSYYDFPDTPDNSSTPNNPSNLYTPTSQQNSTNPNNPNWFARNKQDLGTLGGKALMYGPAIYNIMRSFKKPFQMNAADYQVKSRLNPYEEQYRPDYRAYNAALYSSKNNPNLAARTELFNAGQKQFADEKYRVNQANLGRKMTANQFNIGLEGQNLNTAMQIAQFNQQNKEVPGNMFGQGLTDASNAYQFEKSNQMTGNALASILQHYTLNADGSLTPKIKI